MTEAKPTGLALLRAPFPPNQISKLPKPTSKQTADVKADFNKGIRCQLCGAWHHKDVVHLDYVGHAALTDRLLDCDPEWNWEPAGYMQNGTPAMENGGMWIKLTVCGVTRFGYGAADGKQGGDAIKEVIGDALRNAAMRFGAALDMWHKGDLHGDDDPAPMVEPRQERPPVPQDAIVQACKYLEGADDLQTLQKTWGNLPRDIAAVPAVIAAKDKRKHELQLADTAESVFPAESTNGEKP